MLELRLSLNGTNLFLTFIHFHAHNRQDGIAVGAGPTGEN